MLFKSVLEKESGFLLLYKIHFICAWIGMRYQHFLGFVNPCYSLQWGVLPQGILFVIFLKNENISAIMFSNNPVILNLNSFLHLFSTFQDNKSKFYLWEIFAGNNIFNPSGFTSLQCLFPPARNSCDQGFWMLIHGDPDCESNFWNNDCQS